MDVDRKAHRYAVLSGKGGVGKTLITANLAAALAAQNVRTLVIDADLGLANVDILLGLCPALDLSDLLHGVRTLEDVLVSTRGGFDLLPAGSGILEGTQMTATMAARLEELLLELDRRYDAILFDAGAGIGEVVLFFARMAHTIVMVVTPEPASLTDAYAIIKVLARRYGRGDFSLVVNQVDPVRPDQTGSAVWTHLSDIASRFLSGNTPVPVHLRLAATIPSDPAVPQAIHRQQLLAEASPQAPSTHAISRLAGLLRPTHCHAG